MAITLEEAKVGMAEKIDQAVVDEFRRSSLLLDRLTFDNSISPGTGGSTLSYGYMQLKTPSTAAVRKINSEYKAGEAKRVKKDAAAVIMGGSFEVDRVLQNTSGAIDELAFQAREKILATSNYFHNLVINGATAGSPGGNYVGDTFDGLDKLLAGTSNVITSETDISTSALMDTNNQAFIDELDALVSAVLGGADMLMMNSKMLQRVRSCARRAGYYDREKDDFGRTVEMFGGVPMMDMGGYYNGTRTIDVVATSPNSGSTGKSAIYAVKLGLDAFHGISPMGGGVINSYMPDMSAPGAVKKGEVELVAGVVLKNTLKAAVLKDIPIVAQSA